MISTYPLAYAIKLLCLSFMAIKNKGNSYLFEANVLGQSYCMQRNGLHAVSVNPFFFFLIEQLSHLYTVRQ